MKAQFFLGMGLGAAAAAGVSMLMNTRQPGVQKAMNAANTAPKISATARAALMAAHL